MISSQEVVSVARYHTLHLFPRSARFLRVNSIVNKPFIYSEIGVVSFSIDQSWSPDGTKVSFSEILYNGWVAVPPKIRVYDTVTESFQILSNGNDLYDPESYYIASPINWIEDGLAGDVNGDDSVDVLDVVMLVSYILSGDTSELDGADINNDGDINVLDIVAIVQVILGN